MFLILFYINYLQNFSENFSTAQPIKIIKNQPIK